MSLSTRSDIWKLLFNKYLNVFILLPIKCVNRIRFYSVTSCCKTTCYKIIWVEDEVLQNRTFLSAQQIITFVMTYTATCFDYKFIIVRKLFFLILYYLVFLTWNLVTPLKLHKHLFWCWMIPWDTCKNVECPKWKLGKLFFA